MRWCPALLITAAMMMGLGPAAYSGEKMDASILREIREFKQRGEAYPEWMWHVAQAEYEARQKQAQAALENSSLADGGSDSSSAALIDSNPYLDDGDTSDKGNDIVLGSCATGGSTNAPDAWYRFESADVVDLTLWTTCMSSGSYDTRLAIYDDQLSLLFCNDDASSCTSFQSRITDARLNPGTYFVVVDGYGGASGPYEFNASWQVVGPPCDGSDASTASPIATLPFFDASTTVDACDDILSTCELGGTTSGPDYWYALSLDVSVYLDVSTTCAPGDIDTRILIMTDGQTELYCNDDDPSCASGQSRIEDAVLSPGNYFIVVESPEGPGGTFQVQVDTTHAGVGTTDLLPDLIVREDDLYDHDTTTGVEPGRTHLRLSVGTANVGDGKLYLYGVDPQAGSSDQEVRQRVWRQDDSTWDRLAGSFVYHSGHNHVHIDNWSSFRLRKILVDDGVGDIVATGAKTSFCVLDLAVYDSSLPNYNPNREFSSCGGTVQGLTVGWIDIYSKFLTDQWIDITDVPPGEYWLEAEVDPADHFLELDESNNAARIKVTVGDPGAVSPDAYEPNVDMPSVASRSEGSSNSPNLGPVAPQTQIAALTVHASGNDDFFRFYNPAMGGASDFIRIDFSHSLGDLELALHDDNGIELETSETVADFEQITLQGQPAGWYFARVFGYQGSLHPAYALSLDPSENGQPVIEVTAPPEGDIGIASGFDSYTVEWNASDPEANPTWVTVYLNTSPTFDGAEMLLPTSVNTDGAQGFFIINTAEVPLGTYWVYGSITDGGSIKGDWSAGTISIKDPTDAHALPVQTQMFPSSPNPFNPKTTVRFELAEASMVDGRVYDVRGNLVRQLVSMNLPAGRHRLVWNGLDSSGRATASGVYFVILRAGEKSFRQKLVLLK